SVNSPGNEVAPSQAVFATRQCPGSLHRAPHNATSVAMFRRRCGGVGTVDALDCDSNAGTVGAAAARAGPTLGALDGRRAILTAVFALYTFVLVPALMLFGQLSDRLGRRIVPLMGLAAGAAGLIVFALAESTAWLF